MSKSDTEGQITGGRRQAALGFIFITAIMDVLLLLEGAQEDEPLVLRGAPQRVGEPDVDGL